MVSRSEKPQPKCNNKTRRQTSADLSWRSPLRAPQVCACLCQSAGKKDISNSQSSARAFGVSFSMPPNYITRLNLSTKQVSAYGPLARVSLSRPVGAHERATHGLNLQYIAISG